MIFCWAQLSHGVASHLLPPPPRAPPSRVPAPGTDPVRRVSSGAAAWGGPAGLGGGRPGGACPAACGRQGCEGKGGAGAPAGPAPPYVGGPLPGLPAGCPALAVSTGLRGCLEEQALRGERRGSDLRSGGGRSNDPPRGPSHGVSPGKPLRLHLVPFRALRTAEARLGVEDGGEDSPSPLRAEEAESRAGTGRRAGGGAARVLGHRSPPLRVPRLSPAAQRGGGPSLRS